MLNGQEQVDAKEGVGGATKIERSVLSASRWRPLLGQHLHKFVDDHRQPWDVAMAVLTIVYVVLGIAEDPKRLNLADIAVWTLAVVFLLEFLLRCLDDPSPRQYVRGHWIDLVTCVPAVGPLRLLRLLRLLRVFNTAGMIRKLARSRGDQSSSGGLQMLGATVFAFWLLAGYAFYVTELGQPHTSVHSFPDALFLAFTTGTSVGYSPIKAVSYDGQIVAGLVIFLGLGLLAAASSRLTSLWIEGNPADQDLSDLLHDVRDQLRSSEVRLEAIEKALAQHDPSPPTQQAVPSKSTDNRSAPRRTEL